MLTDEQGAELLHQVRACSADQPIGSHSCHPGLWTRASPDVAGGRRPAAGRRRAAAVASAHVQRYPQDHRQRGSDSRFALRAAAPDGAAFPGENGRFAFQRHDDASLWQVYVASPDLRWEREITDADGNSGWPGVGAGRPANSSGRPCHRRCQLVHSPRTMYT
jgi:hypothetical protein